MRILYNVQEGEMVQSGPPDGNEFGILIEIIFYDCNECGFCKGSLIRWPTRYLIVLNDVHLDVIFKETKK